MYIIGIKKINIFLNKTHLINIEYKAKINTDIASCIN